MKAPSKRLPPIRQVLEIMAALRSPEGCPWDREQDHQTLRWHAVEEVYELLDAIEARDDHEVAEELGDLLLQVVFHAQLARERGVFDFDAICQRLADKLVRRHPHVFGDVAVRDVDQVWVNWEKIKRAEKQGTRHERRSALDGIPARMPALMRAQKLVKKARKAHLMESPSKRRPAATQSALARQLFELAEQCHDRGWSAEELLRSEIRRRERHWRRQEQKTQPRPSVTPEPPGPQTRQASAGSHRK
jgi:NTP pyrophosphatase (non-canonical NTP hydrolase)